MKNKTWKSSFLAGLLAMSMVWGCACSGKETTKKSKEKDEDDTKAEYVVNKLGKDQTADEIPDGMTVEAEEDLDISFCYPLGVYLDYSTDDGYILTYGEDEDAYQIRINKLDQKAEEPEKILKSIKKDVDKEFEKTKGTDVEETKVGKRTLYMETFKGSDVVIDAYVEIYKDFTMVYLAIADKSGEMEAELSSILQTLRFSAAAYDGIEVPEPPVPTTSYLVNSDFNLAITVPSQDAAPDPQCPVGIYVSYPTGNVGAIFLNSDPIGSCVYDAEDLLNSFMNYDGMMAALLLVETAEVINYYDSSFSGIPEIDAEFNFTSNGQSGVGYCRLINGPDIGCYCVFYTLYEPDNAEQKDLFATAIETFEINGAPQQRKFQVHETASGMRFALPTDLYSSIEDDTEAGTTYIVVDQDHFVLTGPELDKNQDLDAYINGVIANFDGAEEHVYENIGYDDSRFQSRLIKGHFTEQGQTWYYSYGITILGDNKPYACLYQSSDSNTEALDEIMDYLLWSINIPAA